MSERDIVALYAGILSGWNRRDATAMAAGFAVDGSLVGFDGSSVEGRAAIAAHLTPIFANHPTPPFTAKVREVRVLTPDSALLRAIAGMVPPGKKELSPALNAVQTLVAVRRDGRWWAAHFQNTPAAFHGRPEEVEAFTEELRQVLESQ
jgi:uncharacterized protein (TIGR02246 family)